MKCLACSAEMRLTEVCPDRTTVCGIERHTFRCSACAHTAKRLMLNRVRMPITNLPVVIPPKAPVIDPHNGRPAAQSAWAKSIEKVNNKQAELKQRAAAATDWASVVEKLSIRLKQQAVAARAEALARTVEELRSRHTGLPVRMADSEFDRVWYGHCPDEAAPKPVASVPELLEMMALLESSPPRVLGAIRMTVKVHHPNRWPPQSQRPSSQMRSCLIGCAPSGLLSAKPVQHQR